MPVKKIKRLLETPYIVIDLFPMQVPSERAAQYLSVEDYLSQPQELKTFAEKIARITLKLSCYYDMEIYHEDERKDTETLAELIKAVISVKKGALNILLADTLMQIVGGDLYVTVYHADEALKSLLQQLVTAEGLFLRKPTEV